jgi:hypothetical protein
VHFVVVCVAAIAGVAASGGISAAVINKAS